MFLNIGWLTALGAAAAWGLLPALTRAIWTGGDASAATASVFLLLRFALSLVAFSAWLQFRRGGLPGRAVLDAWRSSPRARWLLTRWGIVAVANFWIQTLALAEVPAGIYALVFSLHPIAGWLWVRAPLRSGTRALSPTRGRVSAGLAMILVGTLLFCHLEPSGGQVSAGGWLALFGGMATWLLYSTWSRPLHGLGLKPDDVTWMTLALGLVAALPAALHPARGWEILCKQPDIAGCAVAAGLAGMLAFALYQHALKIAPEAAFLAQYAEPLAGVGAAAVFLGEAVTLPQGAAALLSLGGLACLMVRSTEPRCADATALRGT